MAKDEIIIGGVRHVFRTDGGFYPCRRCSLHYICENDPLCQKVFGQKGYFEPPKRTTR